MTCTAGAARFLRELPALLEEKRESLPERLRRMVFALWEEVRDLEERLEAVDAELESVAREQPTIQALHKIPGIGVLSATALFASVGSVHTFRSGRHLASWLGLTPRESSSGNRRRLGRISKQGDPYLRRLLIQGARSALIPAGQRHRAGKPLTRLQAWAVALARRPAHASRAASQDGTHRLGRLVPRAYLRWQLPAAGSLRDSNLASTWTWANSNRRDPADEAHGETSLIWQSGAVRRRGKADNKSDLHQVNCSDWLPACKFHDGPEHTRSTKRPDIRLQPIPSLNVSERSDLQSRRSPYTVGYMPTSASLVIEGIKRVDLTTTHPFRGRSEGNVPESARPPAFQVC